MKGRLRAAAVKACQRYRFDLEGTRQRLQRIGGPHAEPSGVFPPGSGGAPNERLVRLMQDLATACPREPLELLRARGAPDYVHTWPGEHYRLLAALVGLTRPRLVVEVGTYTGHSALAMLDRMGPDTSLVTFDLVPWRAFADTLLIDEDFVDGRVSQRIADLSNPGQFAEHEELVRRAELIFVDASKDGVFEPRLLARLTTVDLHPDALVVLDDIRLWNMLAVWRQIDHPKIDMTSLGHYSGTGVVDWGGTT